MRLFLLIVRVIELLHFCKAQYELYATKLTDESKETCNFPIFYLYAGSYK